MCVLGHHGSDRNEVFVELLMLHQQRLYGFIYTLVPNPADAEDLLQQTSLVLWQKFRRVRSRQEFSRVGLRNCTLSGVALSQGKATQPRCL